MQQDQHVKLFGLWRHSQRRRAAGDSDGWFALRKDMEREALLTWAGCPHCGATAGHGCRGVGDQPLASLHIDRKIAGFDVADHLHVDMWQF